MRPAFSVIFLTTLIGAGQGLFIALYLAELLTLADVVSLPDGRSFFATGSMIVLIFLVGGLVASFFHLGHPERAWRAASMWRTSWLSREVIALPALMATVAVYGLAHYLGDAAPSAGTSGSLTLVVGAIALMLTLTLFICTAMIYACIKFLQEWASALTVANYFLMGTASGFTLAAVFAAFAHRELAEIYAVIAILTTVAALFSRLSSLVRNKRLKRKSTVQSATGIRHPKVVQKAQGAMGGSFNTRHFFHGRTAAFLLAVKWFFLIATFPLPLVLLGGWISTGSTGFLISAFVIQYLGLLAERWYFFVEANHPQNLYYQAIS